MSENERNDNNNIQNGESEQNKKRVIEMDDDLTPKNNSDYSTVEYWELRYEKDKGDFDWFKKWDEIKEVLKEYFDHSSRVLHIGCGNSTVGESLYLEGYKNIVNIDFAPSIIQRMHEKYAVDYPEMTWEVMDITDMKYENESFDIVLDKGTLDALLAPQKSPWEVPDDVGVSIHKMLSETHRVLKQGGKYVYVTFGQPHFRKPLFAPYAWNLELRTIGEMFHYYIYILTKN